MPAPVITSGLGPIGITIDGAVPFTYYITASNSPTSFSVNSGLGMYNNLPPGLTLNASSGLITGIPTAIGTYNVTIAATNSSGAGSATLVLELGYTLPAISSPLTKAVTVGAAATYQITALNGVTGGYSATGLPSGFSINTSTGLISGTATAAGVTSVTIGAINPYGTGTATLVITATVTPAITSALTKAATVGTATTYNITASGTPTSFGATGLPSGFSVNTSTGLISGTPTSGGTYNVTISATNAAGTGSATLVVTVTAAPVVATSYPSISFYSGSTFTITQSVASAFQLTATNSPSSWAATGLPSGLSINTSSGLISGTVASVGVTAFTVTATNGAGASAAASFNVNVVAPPESAPVIQVPGGLPALNVPSGGIGLPSFAQYSPYSYQFYATNYPTSWTLIGAPAGVSIDPALGILSDSGTSPGFYIFTVIAANSAGNSAPVPVALTITAGGAPAAGAEPVTWLTGGLTVVDLQFNLQTRAVASSCSLNFFEGDTLNLGVLLFTPAGQVSDATTIWIEGREAVDQPAILNLTVSGPTALTVISGGEYYAIPVNLAGPNQITEALADLNEPAAPAPAVLTLNCQAAVLRNGITYRSDPFTLAITQRIADAGLPPIYAD